MILSIGEILVDVFSSNEEEKVIPGGAPFNVASNILSFSCLSTFYGTIGDDEYGKLLLDYVNSKKFSSPLIDVKKDKITTQALVKLENGERSFKFIRDNAADYLLDLDNLTKFDYKDIKIVHFGSLMLSKPEGREFLLNAIKFYKKNYPSIKLSFDVNYRDDIFSSKDEAISIYKVYIPLFDLIKISNDEVTELTNNFDIEKGVKELTKSSQYVFLSLGKDGSKLLVNNKTYYSKSIKVTPVDTTGAGDAYYSYILSNIDKYDLSLLNKDEIENILFRANCVGALASLKKGAIDVVPTLEELDKFIKDN